MSHLDKQEISSLLKLILKRETPKKRSHVVGLESGLPVNAFLIRQRSKTDTGAY